MMGAPRERLAEGCDRFTAGEVRWTVRPQTCGAVVDKIGHQMEDRDDSVAGGFPSPAAIFEMTRLQAAPNTPWAPEANAFARGFLSGNSLSPETRTTRTISASSANSWPKTPTTVAVAETEDSNSEMWNDPCLDGCELEDEVDEVAEAAPGGELTEGGNFHLLMMRCIILLALSVGILCFLHHLGIVNIKRRSSRCCPRSNTGYAFCEAAHDLFSVAFGILGAFVCSSMFRPSSEDAERASRVQIYMCLL